MPRADWARVADFARSAVAEHPLKSADEARNILLAAARLADWTARVTGQPLEREYVFSGANIDRFIKTGLDGYWTPSRAGKPGRNLRSSQRIRTRNWLLSLATTAGFRDDARHAAQKRAQFARSTPYTPQQLARLRAAAQSRSTERRRHNWTVLVALGAGAGLTASEVLDVTTNDIVADGCGIAVRVPGKMPRLVPVLPEFEDDVATLLKSSLVSKFLFLTNGRRHPVGTVLNYQISKSAEGVEHPLATRLRATWITRHLAAGTRLDALLRGLGITTADATITHLLQFLPQLDEDQLRAELVAGGAR